MRAEGALAALLIAGMISGRAYGPGNNVRPRATIDPDHVLLVFEYEKPRRSRPGCRWETYQEVIPKAASEDAITGIIRRVSEGRQTRNIRRLLYKHELGKGADS